MENIAISNTDSFSCCPSFSFELVELVIVVGPEDSCTSSKTSRLRARLLGLELLLDRLDLILSNEFFLCLKLFDFDTDGLADFMFFEACNRDLMSINGGGVMIRGELSLELISTDSCSLTDLRINVELRSGNGGGTGECNEVVDILKETLAGEYTSDKRSSTRDVGVSIFAPLVDFSRMMLCMFGFEFGGSSYGLV